MKKKSTNNCICHTNGAIHIPYIYIHTCVYVLQNRSTRTLDYKRAQLGLNKTTSIKISDFY